MDIISGTSYGKSKSVTAGDDDLLADPWNPFDDADAYMSARWFVEADVPKTQINRYFNTGLGGMNTHFRSGHTLWNLVDCMAEGLPAWREGEVGEPGPNARTFYYRSPLDVSQYILRQAAYRGHLKFKPTTDYDPDGHRIYSDIMNTEWAHNTQRKIHISSGREGGTLLPVILASDQAELTDFGGDKKAWPVYMTLGNISPEIRMLPSYSCWVIVGMLPIPPKKVKKKNETVNQAKLERAREVQSVLDAMLEEFKTFDMTGAGKMMDCADGEMRR